MHNRDKADELNSSAEGAWLLDYDAIEYGTAGFDDVDSAVGGVPTEVIVLFDWAPESNESSAGWTEAAGDALFSTLVGLALQAIFEGSGVPEDASSAPRLPAAALIRGVEQDLMANVYRWTGHFPERTRFLLRYLAARAEQLQQVYPADRESAALIALATLVAGLAMNYVLRGSYFP